MSVETFFNSGYPKWDPPTSPGAGLESRVNPTPEILVAVCQMVMLYQSVTEKECLSDLARVASLPRNVHRYTHIAKVGDDATLECDVAGILGDYGNSVGGRTGMSAGVFGPDYNLVWWTSGNDPKTSVNITMRLRSLSVSISSSQLSSF